MGKLILNGIEYAGGPSIDDTNAAATKVYSSQKTQNLVEGTLGADVYDPTHTYATNDMCIYNNTLYKAKSSTTGNLPTNTTYWESTTIADEINELNTGKADASTITSFISQLDDVTITHYNCEGNGGLLALPSYQDFCLIFISRGEGGLYMGHWTGVTPIVNAPNHNVIYYSNPSRINVTNNSASTDRITVIRK